MTKKEGPPTLRDRKMALTQIRWCHDALEKNLNGHQMATVRITLRKVFADLERGEKRTAALDKMAIKVRGLRKAIKTGEVAWDEMARTTYWNIIVGTSMDLDELDALTPAPQEKPTKEIKLDVWQLILRTFNVSYVTRLTMMQELGLRRKSDQDLSDKDLNDAYFKRAKKAGKLQAMWDWLEKHEATK